MVSLKAVVGVSGWMLDGGGTVISSTVYDAIQSRIGLPGARRGSGPISESVNGVFILSC